MSPQEFITELSQRYVVSSTFARRMLPLAHRADEVSPDLRLRLHAFIERSFLAQRRIEAEERARDGLWSPATPADGRILERVGAILHGWEPPRWVALWAERLEREPWLAGGDGEAHRSAEPPGS